MRQVQGRTKGFSGRLVGRVVAAEDCVSEWVPDLNLFVQIDDEYGWNLYARLHDGGLKNILPLTRDRSRFEVLEIALLDEGADLALGDVVAATESQRAFHVLYRESDQHHTVFVTNRCNSYCLMCSQPPTKHEDKWLIQEGIDVARHIRKPPPIIGFSGGEPLLEAPGFRAVLDRFLSVHPETWAEVLTNGRKFADPEVARQVLEGLPRKVSWMIPLYGHADLVHDYVVQSPGAFDETISGLLVLHEYHQVIQIRAVLVEPVLENLLQLCEFIAKNLPFVSDVALMGCEPTGFALANRDICEVDYERWGDVIAAAVKRLVDAGIRPVVMNIPLCLLPNQLWIYAAKSISDWKRVFDTECAECGVRDQCCGLFASYAAGWKPGKIRPVS